MGRLIFVGLLLLSYVSLSQVRVYRIFDGDILRWWVWLISVDSSQTYIVKCGVLDTVNVKGGTVKTWLSERCPVDSPLWISTQDQTWFVGSHKQEPLSDIIPLKDEFEPALGNPERLYVEVRTDGDSAKLIIIKNGRDSVVQWVKESLSLGVRVDTSLISLEVVLIAGANVIKRQWYANLENFFDTVNSEMLFHYAKAMLVLYENEQLSKYIKDGDTESVRSIMKDIWRGKMYVFWEFKRRVDYALEHFSTRTEAGYETDRGRVLIQYGFPDQRFVKNMEPGVLPYEIWIYRQLKGFFNVRFVFYNPYIASNYYELIHSTLPGEIFNPYWERYVMEGEKDPQYWNPDRTKGRSYFGKQVRDYYEFYAPSD